MRNCTTSHCTTLTDSSAFVRSLTSTGPVRPPVHAVGPGHQWYSTPDMVGGERGVGEKSERQQGE